jgi:hypothetical protein
MRHPASGVPGLPSPDGWIGGQYPKSVRQVLIGNEKAALRDAFEKCTRPCMRQHPLVLSESSVSSAATVARLASCLWRLGIIGIRNPNEQFSLHMIQDAQPVRLLWHVQRVEERLRLHRCRVEIVGDYRNTIQCRVLFVGLVRKNSTAKFITRLLSDLREVYHGNGRFRASILVFGRGPNYEPGTQPTSKRPIGRFNDASAGSRHAQRQRVGWFGSQGP